MTLAVFGATTGPITGSANQYREVPGHEGTAVPFRRVNLSNGEHLDPYDTSGPYPDRGAVIDLTRGRVGHPRVSTLDLVMCT
jgi:phosphomethylpyrimidine synthase